MRLLVRCLIEGLEMSAHDRLEQSSRDPHSAFGNSTVVITGGTGSFGHAMTQRLLSYNCGEVRIFSRDEAKQHAMRNEFQDSQLRYYIGDVRDYDSIARVVRGADFVFHAAALKQVPSCEFFPLEAVYTNVVGSANVLRAAASLGVRSVVCLSTDKAVAPLNAMGMSKALMEKLVVAEARVLGSSETIVSSVRYGNVLYSRGSVVPLFVEQAVSGAPMTITDPRMTRFMMNLEEAVGLVEHAFMNARQGDLFIRKAPAAQMPDVAEVVRSLLGSDSDIRTIGIRHGEKLHETLATAEELGRADDHGDFFRVPMDDRDLDYSKYFVEGDRAVGDRGDFTSENAVRMSRREIESLLLTVPELQQFEKTERDAQQVGS